MRILLLIFCLPIGIFSQQVVLDESFQDWNDYLIYEDALNDGSNNGLDFKNLWVTNDDRYLYISFDTEKEIILQDYNGLSLNIDLDNDASTGSSINGIGADLLYDFSADGTRKLFYNGFDYFIDHVDVEFVALPTVSSDRFEIKIAKQLYANGNLVNMGSSIKIVLKDGGGDFLPDQNELTYQLSDQVYSDEYNFEKTNSDDIRIMSYNVRFDGYFEDGSREAINRILRATNPDIIAFQEIYDHSAEETELQVATALNVPSSELYSSKVFPDIIMVSKFPIEDVTTVSGTGNGAFKINDGTREWLFINVHLPCCDNNAGRDQEVQLIMEFIEDVKSGNANIELAPNSPIVILGDTNFVGPMSQPHSFLNGIADGPDWGGEMEDAIPRTTGEPASFTWHSPFSNFSPGRLDYVVYSGSVLKKKNNFTLYTPSLTAQELSQYGLNEDDSFIATDHLAVIVDFDKQAISQVIDQSQNDEVSFYPNPFLNRLNIPESVESFEIYSVNGSKVLRSDSSKSWVDTSVLSPGLYLIRYRLNNTIQSELIIKADLK